MDFMVQIVDPKLCESALKNGHLCKLFKGETSILLDNEIGGVDTLVYNVIESTLNDEEYLQRSVSSNIVQAAFIFPMSQNLVIIGKKQDPQVKSESNGTLKVVLSAVGVSVFLAFVFLVGVLYHSPENEMQKQDTKNRFYFYQMKRRQFFEHLEDEPSFQPDWMAASGNKPATKSPAKTWSVSDLTSDTHSIKENLPMVRIDEESALEVYAEIYVNDDNRIQNKKQRQLASHHLQFLSKWNKQSDASEIGSYSNIAKVRLHKDSISDDESSAAISEQTFERYDFRDIVQVISDKSPIYATSTGARIELFDAIPSNSSEVNISKPKRPIFVREQRTKRKSQDDLDRNTYPKPTMGSNFSNMRKENGDLQMEGEPEVWIKAFPEATPLIFTDPGTHSTNKIPDYSKDHISESNITDKTGIAVLKVGSDASFGTEATSPSSLTMITEPDQGKTNNSSFDFKMIFFNLWLHALILNLERCKQQKLISY
jgi:hypothetical protein